MDSCWQVLRKQGTCLEWLINHSHAKIHFFFVFPFLCPPASLLPFTKILESPTHLSRSLLRTFPQTAQPTLQVSGFLVPPLDQPTDHQSRAEIWCQRLMSTVKSRVEAGTPSFTATRASHTLRFDSEIKVHRMQFPIVLGGRNVSGIWVNNILGAIILWQVSVGRLKKASHPIVEVLGFLAMLLVNVDTPIRVSVSLWNMKSIQLNSYCSKWLNSCLL